MKKQYIAINIYAGIGIMSLAFEQAGFKVICNLVEEQREKRIISENLDTRVGFFNDFAPERLPSADVIIGSLVQFHDCSMIKVRKHEQFQEYREEVFQAISNYVRPKAFFFEINVRIQKNNLLHRITEQFKKEGYELYYHEIDVREMTGSPIRQRRGYMIVVRKDICTSFLFPENTVYFQAFEEFQEKDVDYAYNVKNEKTISECWGKDNGLYVWKGGKYQRDKEINSIYRIPILKSDERLRRVTLRELARIKGIPDDYKLSVENKSWLYREIWYEPHMKLISLLASELYRVLEDDLNGKDSTIKEEQTRIQAKRITAEEEQIAVQEKQHTAEKEQYAVEKDNNILVGETHMMERRFDVFVSSTYEDLKDERKEVTQAILECDCMPVGMEMFPASNLEQWKFIQKVIDKSDIYLVIIAGKYGSEYMDEKNRIVSYTEREFEYALKQGKPVLAFLVDDIGKLERNKTEVNNDKMERLMKFRKRVITGRLVKFYMNKDDLKAKVMGSLNQIKKQINSGGWVRADENNNFAIDEMKRNISALKTEKENLQKQIETFRIKENENRYKYDKMSTELDEMYQSTELFKKQIQDFKAYINAGNNGNDFTGL